MSQVYLLVAVPVFALAGALSLTLFVWSSIRDYARARRAIRQISTIHRLHRPEVTA
jgi:hypothetical protein